jgi:hypothetical protein
MTHPITRAGIEEYDQPILQHLTDVAVSEGSENLEGEDVRVTTRAALLKLPDSRSLPRRQSLSR